MSDPAGFAAAFRAQVRQRPQATALVWHDRQISYGELAAAAAGWRTRIAVLDLAQDEPVGVLTTKSPAAVALVLACLLSGRRFLLPSPALAPSALDELFAQAGCRHVLTTDDAPTPPDGSSETDAGAHDAAPADGDVALMLTTSGSTGLPKIVPISHGAVDRFTRWAGPAFDIGPGSTVLNYAPLNFDLCLLDVWTTLAYGGRVVLVDTDRAVNAGHLLDLLVRHRVDVVQAVPMFYGLVLDAVRAGAPDTRLDTVKHLMFTGDVIGEQTLTDLPGLFPAARLYNVYGCTETNDSFIHEVRADGTTPYPVPLGEPLPGVRTLVIDADGQALDGSGTGELYVSTPFQSAGYLDTGRHLDRFVGHPLGRDDSAWFRTGDLVRRDPDGRNFLVGRSDFQVKIRGVAINTAEVEAVLLEHPDVLEAAVAARPDPLTGRRLVSAIRRAPGSTLNTLTLRAHCARRLPQAAIPSTIQVVDEALPRTSTGKVDRTAIDRPRELARATGGKS